MSILRDIRDYLQPRGQVSLNDLVMHFDTSPDAMRGMLDNWIAKGRVTHCPASACSACSRNCSSAPGDSYEWLTYH